MSDRIEMLVGALDLSTSRGLEIGPLMNPVVRRDMGDIRYVDHVDSETLRARYGSHDGFDLEATVDIDYAIGDGSLRQAVGLDAPFDYVVASHVIEHVPDLVGWLDDVRSVLTDDGLLTLAVPDHRCCFDAIRSPTVLADVVHAHLSGSRVPTARQVFDHYASAVSWRDSITWTQEAPIGELQAVHTEQEAIQRAAGVETSGDYQDVHCWVFTPRSFARVVAGMQRLGMISLHLEACSDSIGGEFFAKLRATTRDQAIAAADARHSSVEDRLAAEPASVRAEFATVRVELAAVRAELAETRRQLALAQDELSAVARSRSWRITAPLRFVNARRVRSR